MMAKIEPFGFDRERARRKIRQIARESSRVIISGAAKQQMIEQEILVVLVYRVLSSGDVVEDPEQTAHGQWRCKVRYRVAGQFDLAVVAAIIQGQQLFIESVEWETTS